MAIEDAEARKVGEWFDSKGGLKPCLACGSTDGWNIGQVIQPIPRPPTVDADGERVDERHSVPQVAGFPLLEMICRNCAYVMLFAAKPMRIV